MIITALLRPPRRQLPPEPARRIARARGDVLAAAVVGARDDVLGERPVAYVVPADPGGVDQLERALRPACAAELPHYKRPSEIVVVDALPTGPTGKRADRKDRQEPPPRADRTASVTQR